MQCGFINIHAKYLQANSRLEKLSEKIKWFENKEKYTEVFLLNN